MKGDMSGGGAVIAGDVRDRRPQAAAPRHRASSPRRRTCPAATPFRPGDVLRAMNGKTIEIINTDAEGRLVLADALWYAREQGADAYRRSRDAHRRDGDRARRRLRGIFANDDALARPAARRREAAGDHLWRFPLHPRYRRYVDSTFADMKNSGDLREGSPVTRGRVPAGVRRKGAVGAPRHRGSRVPGPVARRLPVAGRRHSGYGVRLIAELATRLSA